jgi:hypothetical protein
MGSPDRTGAIYNYGTEAEAPASENNSDLVRRPAHRPQGPTQYSIGV